MAQADSDNSTPTPAPGESQDSLYVDTGVSPEQMFRAIGKLRRDARDEIDRLLRFLDETENHMAIDCEPEDEADDSEAEPSLGSFDRMVDQSKAWRQQSLWAFPAVDGEQDNADAEPSLGSVSNFAHSHQEHWADGNRRDLEIDDGESGVADQDGLDEQVPFRDWQGVGMV